MFFYSTRKQDNKRKDPQAQLTFSTTQHTGLQKDTLADMKIRWGTLHSVMVVTRIAQCLTLTIFVWAETWNRGDAWIEKIDTQPLQIVSNLAAGSGVVLQLSQLSQYGKTASLVSKVAKFRRPLNPRYFSPKGAIWLLCVWSSVQSGLYWSGCDVVPTMLNFWLHWSSSRWCILKSLMLDKKCHKMVQHCIDR